MAGLLTERNHFVMLSHLELQLNRCFKRVQLYNGLLVTRISKFVHTSDTCNKFPVIIILFYSETPNLMLAEQVLENANLRMKLSSVRFVLCVCLSFLSFYLVFVSN